MLELQVARLTQAHPRTFSPAIAAITVARAYGYHKLDLSTGELSDPVAGLQLVRPYEDILSKDRTHQVIDFMRMAVNLSIPDKVDHRHGVPEREIVCAMLNFSNFDSVLSYARGDSVDPNTTDKAMLAKFQHRYGYYAPIQYLLGLYVREHTLIIQPDGPKAQRIVDQEIALNPLDKLKVVILRDDPAGDIWLKVMTRSVASFTGALDDGYSRKARAAMGKHPVLVSKLPREPYSLTDLVRANLAVMGEGEQGGRTLIVDRLNLVPDAADYETAYELATARDMHLVVIVKEPDAELWKLSGIHLIFGFPDGLAETYLEMDKHIGYAAPYVGFKNGKMQYLYQSAISGPRFGAMDLIPDDQKTKSLMQRFKEALSG